MQEYLVSPNPAAASTVMKYEHHRLKQSSYPCHNYQFQQWEYDPQSLRFELGTVPTLWG